MKNDSKLTEAYIRSTINVLDTLCGFSDISFNSSPQPTPSESDDIIGIMGVNGPLAGSTLIIVPEHYAVTIVSRMTGSEEGELSRIEVGHGVAELLNIICGNAKTILSDSEFSFNLTVPRMLSCRDYKIDDYGLNSFSLEFKNSEVKFQLFIGYSLQKCLKKEEVVSQNARA